MQIIAATSAIDGIDATCDALGVCRASFFRWKQPKVYGPRHRLPPPRALVPAETRAVLDVLHEDRFADLAPAAVYATLLDEGRYLCSPRTMYRILAAHDEVRERRAQCRRAHYAAPELLATKPNQLWSWDITKLKGPTPWRYFHLYVIIDVFSRYVVGWMVAPRESATLAEKLIAATCARQGIQRGQLTVHADRGSSMRSKLVAQLLADLGVAKTHSRPHVSNDNPFSEAGFKTLKYRPGFPDRFGSLEDARAYCADFFAWYNAEHYHSGLGLQTPEAVHAGRAQTVVDERTTVLAAAHAAHPERFVRGIPRPAAVPTEVWINKPTSATRADRSARPTAPTTTSPNPTAAREDRTARPPANAPQAGSSARNHVATASLN
jgi:putative transposase